MIWFTMLTIGYVIGHLGFGGAEKQLTELILSLDRSHFRPVVFCLSEERIPFGKILEKNAIKVYYMKRRMHFDITRVLKLSYLCKIEQVNILHSFLHIANLYAFVSSFFSIPYILLPSVRSMEKEKGILFWLFNYLNFMYVSKIIVNSENVKYFVIDFFKVSHSKIEVIYNGLDIQKVIAFSSEKVNQLRDQLAIPSNKIVIGLVGKWTRKKNIPLFARVAEYLLEINQDLHFILVGRDLDEKMKRQLIKDKYQANFHFLGERKDMGTIYSLIDIYTSTSRSEGLSNAIMEAMAFSKPVVATNVGGSAELVLNGKTGFLVESEDEQGLQENLIKLINNPDLRKKIGQEGKKHIERFFTTDKMVEKYEQLYMEITNHRNA